LLNLSPRVPKNKYNFLLHITTTAICATEIPTSGMTTNLAPTLMLPISLPHCQSSTAPNFDSKTPSTLGTYLSDYKSLAEAAQLSPEEHLAQSTHYLTEEDKEDWEILRHTPKLDYVQGSPLLGVSQSQKIFHIIG